MNKKIMSIFGAVTICFSSTACAEDIRVKLNEKTLEFDVAPTIVDDRTLVPMRTIFEELGADVSWDNDTLTATGVLDDTTVSITVNESELIKNGQSIELDSPAIIIDDRTLVPVRAVSEAFGCGVSWDSKTYTVNISSIGYLPEYGIPAYSGSAFSYINDNEPFFSEDEYTEKAFESYSILDKLGRVGVASACIGTEIMPTEERSSIGMVKPSGWQSVKYNFVDGKYLYNRCHLIGFQLSGENANERNLMTGTRYMNTEGMLPFENAVADYVKSTNNHVLYRVTPMFRGDNLIADGVMIEAKSIEDDRICFNVFCYNIQPGVVIDYTNGNSYEGITNVNPSESEHYILNTNSKKFHLESCESVSKMSSKNREDYNGTREDLINKGYTPCNSCSP